MGLIINERAGVLNLGAEGIMLCGALAGVAFYLLFGSNIIFGLLGSLLIGGLVGALFAILVVIFRTNQVVTGITFVFLGSGLTGLIGPSFTDKAVKDIKTGLVEIRNDKDGNLASTIGRKSFSSEKLIENLVCCGGPPLSPRPPSGLASAARACTTRSDVHT